MNDTWASEFDQAVAVGTDGSAAIAPGWDINGNANGGYLLALVANGMAAAAGRRYPLTVTGHYLLPGTPGPVDVDAQVVKAGRRLTTVTGALRRDGATMLQAVGTFTDSVGDPDSEPRVIAGAPPDVPDYVDCLPRGRHQNGPEVPLMERLAVRMRAADVGYVTGNPTGVAEMAGWFAFADGRPVDPLALLLCGDAFPPAVFNLHLRPGWVPTVEYTVHVRGIPAPGPVACVFRSQFVHGGMLNEDGEMWDSEGRLVAQSRQLGLLPA